MNTLRNVATTLAGGLMLIAAASPTLAKERAARAGFEARAEAIGGELATRSGDRASAIRECNEKGSKFTEYSWGNREFDVYRACMAERGQQE